MAIADSLVRKTVRRLLAVTRPDRIVLFGSAASNRITPDSDIDLPVVASSPANTIEELGSNHFKFSNEIAMRFRVVGTGPHKLLLLHGFCASIETWEDIRPLLADRCTLYLLDLKGHGLSSKPRDSHYSPHHQAEIVAAFISAMGLKDLTLLGHSLGGGVALLTCLKLAGAQETAGTIRSLILIAAAAYPQQLPFFVSTLRTPVLGALLLNLTSARYGAKFTLNRILHDRAQVTPARVARYARYLDLPGTHHALVHTAKQILPDDVHALLGGLKTIAVPTLIVWGQEDPVIPVHNARRLNADIPGSRVEVLQRCGHIPHEEQPDVTADLIRRFLDEA